MRILAAAAVLTVLGATACSTEAEMRAVDPAAGSGAAADASLGRGAAARARTVRCARAAW